MIVIVTNSLIITPLPPLGIIIIISLTSITSDSSNSGAPGGLSSDVMNLIFVCRAMLSVSDWSEQRRARGKRFEWVMKVKVAPNNKDWDH